MEGPIRDYTLKELFVGMSEEFSTVITEEMMQKFLDISGDHNPLHKDTHFAQAMGFPNKVVFGMLTASLISTLGGCYLPGKHCLLQKVEIQFVKPVFLGDTLRVVGKVHEIFEALNCVVIDVSIYNQSGARVLRGRLRAGVLHE